MGVTLLVSLKKTKTGQFRLRLTTLRKGTWVSFKTDNFLAGRSDQNCYFKSIWTIKVTSLL